MINPTEALVAIDVNSGKATRERHIEETALKTNLEAAAEVARQLRLRDLAGLIVIDFIDMEESRHNREVERHLKDSMRLDRARIQLGRISPFGLLELSRQRLRPSLFESSTEPCSRCGGAGHIRSADSTAHHVVRLLEEEGIVRGGGDVCVALPTDVAFYLMNHMRGRLNEIEQRFGLIITIERDDGLVPPDMRLTRRDDSGKPMPAAEPKATKAKAEDEDGRRRRGRRRRRGKDGDEPAHETPESTVSEDAETAVEPVESAEPAEDGEAPPAGPVREGRTDRRRRGRRGGRRRSRKRGEGTARDTASTNDGQTSTEAEPAGADETVASGDQPDPDSEGTPAEQTKPPRSSGRSRSRSRRPRAAKGSDENQSSDAPSTPSPDRQRRPAQRRASTDELVDDPGSAPQPFVPAPGDQDPLPPVQDDPVTANQSDPVSVEPVAAATSRRLESSESDGSPDIGGESEQDRPKRKGWWQRWV